MKIVLDAGCPLDAETMFSLFYRIDADACPDEEAALRTILFSGGSTSYHDATVSAEGGEVEIVEPNWTFRAVQSHDDEPTGFCWEAPHDLGTWTLSVNGNVAHFQAWVGHTLGGLMMVQKAS